MGKKSNFKNMETSKDSADHQELPLKQSNSPGIPFVDLNMTQAPGPGFEIVERIKFRDQSLGTPSLLHPSRPDMRATCFA